MSEATQTFTKDMVIGEILAAKPAASKVIEKYFGDGCFTCPGISMETIAFGSSMHGVDADEVVEQLNTVTD